MAALELESSTSISVQSESTTMRNANGNGHRYEHGIGNTRHAASSSALITGQLKNDDEDDPHQRGIPYDGFRWSLIKSNNRDRGIPIPIPMQMQAMMHLRILMLFAQIRMTTCSVYDNNTIGNDTFLP